MWYRSIALLDKVWEFWSFRKSEYSFSDDIEGIAQRYTEMKFFKPQVFRYCDIDSQSKIICT